MNKTLDANKLYQGSADERRRTIFESKKGNFLLALLLVLVGYERERKKATKRRYAVNFKYF